MTVYHVYANRSNVGDWLSAKGIQSLLKPLVPVDLLCDEPFVLETLDRLQEAGPGDLVVIGGGGLLMDYFEPFWRGLARVAERVPFVLWGVGCCAMKRQESRPAAALVGPIAARARMCVVRDELTREFLGEYVAARVVPCPTLNVVAERPGGWGVLHVDAYDNVGEAVYQEMERVGGEFAARTGRPFWSINNLIPGGSEKALAGVLDLYAGADVVLTGRLHGCIVGLGMGKKVVAVSGDNKVEAFLQAAGLREWVLGLDELDRLKERLAELPGQPAPAEFLARARRGNEGVAAEVWHP